MLAGRALVAVIAIAVGRVDPVTLARATTEDAAGRMLPALRRAVATAIGASLELRHDITSSSSPIGLRLRTFGSGLSRPSSCRRRHIATAQASSVSCDANSTP